MATAIAEKTGRKGPGLPEAGVALVTGSTVAIVGTAGTKLRNLQVGLHAPESVATLNNSLNNLKSAVDRAAPDSVKIAKDNLEGIALFKEINFTISSASTAVKNITNSYIDEATVHAGAPFVDGIRTAKEPLIENLGKLTTLTP